MDVHLVGNGSSGGRREDEYRIIFFIWVVLAWCAVGVQSVKGIFSTLSFSKL